MKEKSAGSSWYQVSLSVWTVQVSPEAGTLAWVVKRPFASVVACPVQVLPCRMLR